MIIAIIGDKIYSSDNDVFRDASIAYTDFLDSTGTPFNQITKDKINERINTLIDQRLVNDNPQPVYKRDVYDIVYNSVFTDIVKQAHKNNQNLSISKFVRFNDDGFEVISYEISLENRPLESEPLPPLDQILNNLPNNPIDLPRDVFPSDQPDRTTEVSPPRGFQPLPDGFIDFPNEPNIEPPKRFPQSPTGERVDTIIINITEGNKHETDTPRRDSNDTPDDTPEDTPEENEDTEETGESEEDGETLQITSILESIRAEIEKQNNLNREQTQLIHDATISSFTDTIERINPKPELGSISDSLSNLGNTLKSFITDPLVSVFNTVDTTIKNGFQFIQVSIEALKEGVTNGFKSLTDLVTEYFTKTWDAITEAFKFDLESMTKTLCEIIDMINKMASLCKWTRKPGA